MRLDGRFSVQAGQAEVYDLLTDPRRVSRFMPDVKTVEIQDADHFTVTARVGIAHIKGTMVMKLTISNRNPPISTVMSGQGTGMASMIDMVTSFTLETGGSGETIVNWTGDVNVAGKLAAFGSQGLLDRIGKKNVEKFIDGIKAGIEKLPAAPHPVG